MHVLVCGAGVIGAACAYFLSKRGAKVTVVEQVAVASAASGKSGGFLARDWCDGQAQSALARVSFELHHRLAEELDGDYGFRPVTTRLAICSQRRDVTPYRRVPSPAWLEGGAAIAETLGNEASTAQIDPARFTRALIDAATMHGARLQIARVEELLTKDSGRRVCGVIADGEALSADKVIVAMGPWSQAFAAQLSLPPILGLKGYSVVLRPEAELPPEALFIEYESETGERSSPELVTRADGSVYLCGIGDEEPVPSDPRQVSIDDNACDELARRARHIAPVLQSAPVTHRQACYRPICADAMPIMGACEPLDGVYIATGHNCWGMLNAPASGLAMSELVLDGAPKCVDLAPFHPHRVMR